MNEAEALRGTELRIAAEAIRPLAPGAHYVHDLVTCQVETVDGRIVGRVTDVQFGTGTPMLVVGATNGDEVLVPLAEDICRIVDPAAGRIVIDPPEGLVELNQLSRTARR
jgi:16S rRNA processing protein RimM